jgi:hypothetical protein
MQTLHSFTLQAGALITTALNPLTGESVQLRLMKTAVTNNLVPHWRLVFFFKP